MALRVGHASIDERGKAKNGKSGDQTGKEVCIRSWYNKPWDYVLRCPDRNKAKEAVKVMIELANSNLVGYDQNQRNTLYLKLKLFNFDPKAYKMCGVKTETDCSAFIYACWCCADERLRRDGNAPTTSTMKDVFSKKGFKVLTDKKYTSSPDYLLEGDILVKAGSHTVMVLDNGSKASKSSNTKINEQKSVSGYKAKITADILNIRSGAGATYNKVGTYKKNTVVTITKVSNGWGKTSKGWISLSHIKKI